MGGKFGLFTLLWMPQKLRNYEDDLEKRVDF